MKFVEGETLEVHRLKDPEIPNLLRIFQKVCEAVEFAHSRGVLHRDLKPSNIMAGPFGEVLVMDWGIASRVKGDTSNEAKDLSVSDIDAESSIPDTAHGTVLGTPSYMSPEQARGDVTLLDNRTDVYGLGAILYFLLTGFPPHPGDSVDTILNRIVAGDLKRPREIAQGMPKRLEAICLKAMHREPILRYASARELASDVTRYLDNLPVDAYPENLFEKSSRWISRNQFIVFVVLAYIIVRLIVLFWTGI
jgi:serine/threonine protein kinase